MNNFPTAAPMASPTTDAPALPPDMNSAIAEMLTRAAPSGNDFLAGLNFNDVKGGGSYRLLPAKTKLSARIQKIEFARSAAGNDMWKLILETTGPGDLGGVTLYDNVVHTVKAAWKLKSLITACLGPDGKPTTLSADGSKYTGDKTGQVFVGQEIVLEVEHEPYTKKDGTEGIRNKVAGGYRPLSSLTPAAQPAAPADAPANPTPGVQW